MKTVGCLRVGLLALVSSFKDSFITQQVVAVYPLPLAVCNLNQWSAVDTTQICMCVLCAIQHGTVTIYLIIAQLLSVGGGSVFLWASAFLVTQLRV